MRNRLAAKSVRCGDSESLGLVREIFEHTVSWFCDDTRASFSQSRIFLVVIENKIHFFLVAFATDF